QENTGRATLLMRRPGPKWNGVNGICLTAWGPADRSGVQPRRGSLAASIIEQFGDREMRHDAASLSRPDARRPLAMSIFVALYLSGAAFASAVETAGVARSALSVFPLRKASTARSRYG